jgi:predicted ArsR family transcriptional regulator
MLSRKTLSLGHLMDPVRLSLLERLAGPEPASVDELADAAGVHANTVRSHVGALEAQGIVVREHRPTGARGRPPVRYRLAEGVQLPATDYRGLAELLAATVAAIEPGHKQLQAIGHEWGRWLAGRPGTGDAREKAAAAMTALGFEADIDDDRVLLSRCPCPLVAPDRPEVVCQLAAAVLDGVVSASKERLEVGSSVHEPAARRCELRLAPRGSRRRLPTLRFRHS